MTEKPVEQVKIIGIQKKQPRYADDTRPFFRRDYTIKGDVDGSKKQQAKNYLDTKVNFLNEVMKFLPRQMTDVLTGHKNEKKSIDAQYKQDLMADSYFNQDLYQGTTDPATGLWKGQQSPLLNTLFSDVTTLADGTTINLSQFAGMLGVPYDGAIGLGVELEDGSVRKVAAQPVGSSFELSYVNVNGDPVVITNDTTKYKLVPMVEGLNGSTFAKYFAEGVNFHPTLVDMKHTLVSDAPDVLPSSVKLSLSLNPLAGLTTAESGIVSKYSVISAGTATSPKYDITATGPMTAPERAVLLNKVTLANDIKAINDAYNAIADGKIDDPTGTFTTTALNQDQYAKDYLSKVGVYMPTVDYSNVFKSFMAGSPLAGIGTVDGREKYTYDKVFDKGDNSSQEFDTFLAKIKLHLTVPGQTLDYVPNIFEIARSGLDLEAVYQVGDKLPGATIGLVSGASEVGKKKWTDKDIFYLSMLMLESRRRFTDGMSNVFGANSQTLDLAALVKNYSPNMTNIWKWDIDKQLYYADVPVNGNGETRTEKVYNYAIPQPDVPVITGAPADASNTKNYLSNRAVEAQCYRAALDIYSSTLQRNINYCLTSEIKSKAGVIAPTGNLKLLCDQLDAANSRSSEKLDSKAIHSILQILKTCKEEATPGSPLAIYLADKEATILKYGRDSLSAPNLATKLTSEYQINNLGISDTTNVVNKVVSEMVNLTTSASPNASSNASSYNYDGVSAYLQSRLEVTHEDTVNASNPRLVTPIVSTDSVLTFLEQNVEKKLRPFYGLNAVDSFNAISYGKASVTEGSESISIGYMPATVAKNNSVSAYLPEKLRLSGVDASTSADLSIGDRMYLTMIQEMQKMADFYMMSMFSSPHDNNATDFNFLRSLKDGLGAGDGNVNDATFTNGSKSGLMSGVLQALVSDAAAQKDPDKERLAAAEGRATTSIAQASRFTSATSLRSDADNIEKILNESMKADYKKETTFLGSLYSRTKNLNLGDLTSPASSLTALNTHLTTSPFDPVITPESLTLGLQNLIAAVSTASDLESSATPAFLGSGSLHVNKQQALLNILQDPSFEALIDNIKTQKNPPDGLANSATNPNVDQNILLFNSGISSLLASSRTSSNYLNVKTTHDTVLSTDIEIARGYLSQLTDTKWKLPEAFIGASTGFNTHMTALANGTFDTGLLQTNEKTAPDFKSLTGTDLAAFNTYLRTLARDSSTTANLRSTSDATALAADINGRVNTFNASAATSQNGTAIVPATSDTTFTAKIAKNIKSTLSSGDVVYGTSKTTAPHEYRQLQKHVFNYTKTTTTPTTTTGAAGRAMPTTSVPGETIGPVTATNLTSRYTYDVTTASAPSGGYVPTLATGETNGAITETHLTSTYTYDVIDNGGVFTTTDPISVQSAQPVGNSVIIQSTDTTTNPVTYTVYVSTVKHTSVDASSGGYDPGVGYNNMTETPKTSSYAYTVTQASAPSGVPYVPILASGETKGAITETPLTSQYDYNVIKVEEKVNQTAYETASTGVAITATSDSWVNDGMAEVKTNWVANWKDVQNSTSTLEWNGTNWVETRTTTQQRKFNGFGPDEVIPEPGLPTTGGFSYQWINGTSVAEPAHPDEAIVYKEGSASGGLVVDHGDIPTQTIPNVPSEGGVPAFFGTTGSSSMTMTIDTTGVHVGRTGTASLALSTPNPINSSTFTSDDAFVDMWVRGTLFSSTGDASSVRGVNASGQPIVHYFSNQTAGNYDSLLDEFTRDFVGKKVGYNVATSDAGFNPLTDTTQPGFNAKWNFYNMGYSDYTIPSTYDILKLANKNFTDLAYSPEENLKGQYNKKRAQLLEILNAGTSGHGGLQKLMFDEFYMKGNFNHLMLSSEFQGRYSDGFTSDTMGGVANRAGWYESRGRLLTTADNLLNTAEILTGFSGSLDAFIASSNGKFVYDTGTKKLTINGAMTLVEAATLKSTSGMSTDNQAAIDTLLKETNKNYLTTMDFTDVSTVLISKLKAFAAANVDRYYFDDTSKKLTVLGSINSTVVESIIQTRGASIGNVSESLSTPPAALAAYATAHPDRFTYASTTKTLTALGVMTDYEATKLKEGMTPADEKVIDLLLFRSLGADISTVSLPDTLTGLPDNNAQKKQILKEFLAFAKFHKDKYFFNETTNQLLVHGTAIDAQGLNQIIGLGTDLVGFGTAITDFISGANTDYAVPMADENLLYSMVAQSSYYDPVTYPLTTVPDTVKLTDFLNKYAGKYAYNTTSKNLTTYSAMTGEEVTALKLVFTSDTAIIDDMKFLSDGNDLVSADFNSSSDGIKSALASFVATLPADPKRMYFSSDNKLMTRGPMKMSDVESLTGIAGMTLEKQLVYEMYARSNKKNLISRTLTSGLAPSAFSDTYNGKYSYDADGKLTTFGAMTAAEASALKLKFTSAADGTKIDEMYFLSQHAEYDPTEGKLGDALITAATTPTTLVDYVAGHLDKFYYDSTNKTLSVNDEMTDTEVTALKAYLTTPGDKAMIDNMKSRSKKQRPQPVIITVGSDNTSIATFASNSAGKYLYSSATGVLVVTGEMTDSEVAQLKSYITGATNQAKIDEMQFRSKGYVIIGNLSAASPETALAAYAANYFASNGWKKFAYNSTTHKLMVHGELTQAEVEGLKTISGMSVADKAAIDDIVNQSRKFRNEKTSMDFAAFDYSVDTDLQSQKNAVSALSDSSDKRSSKMAKVRDYYNAPTLNAGTLAPSKSRPDDSLRVGKTLDMLHINLELNALYQEISLAGIYTDLYNDGNKQSEKVAQARYEEDMRKYQEDQQYDQLMEGKATAAAAQRRAAMKGGRRR